MPCASWAYGPGRLSGERACARLLVTLEVIVGGACPAGPYDAPGSSPMRTEGLGFVSLNGWTFLSACVWFSKMVYSPFSSRFTPTHLAFTGIPRPCSAR